MKAILGRLSELGLREISKLLTAAGAEGVLDIDGPSAGRESRVYTEVNTEDLEDLTWHPIRKAQ